MKLLVTSGLLMALFFPRAFAQKLQHTDTHIEQLVENIFAVQEEDLNYAELYESLLHYYSDPLDLNKSSKDELRSLYILTEQQINDLLAYREKYGKFLSIYELQAVPGLELSIIEKLLPFVSIHDDGLSANNRPLLRRIISEPNNYLLFRYERTLEEKKGFSYANADGIPKYTGSPNKMYTRFRISHTHDFSIGLTAEKDAGELLHIDKSKATYGADFYSFHFQLQNQGKLKNLVLGDYQVQAGQSLLLAAGFNIGKGSETITTVRRANLGILPYTSVIETNYLRGAAATYKLNKKLHLTGFYSRLLQDATIQETGHRWVSSIRSTGLHRTKQELASKNQLTQQTWGGQLLYSNYSDNLQVGAVFIADHFSLPLIPPAHPYKRFDFSGTMNHNLGLSFHYTWQNYSFFGEAARSKNGGYGAIGGVMVNLTRQLQASVLLRNYDRNFHSFHGQAFAEAAGLNRNERGWYWGLKYSPSKRYRFTTYFDWFKFPWLKFRVDAPSDGYEYLFRANYQPLKTVNLYVQYRQESKAINLQGTETVKAPQNGIKQNYTLNLNYMMDETISLRSRIQWSSYHISEQKSTGYAMAQDLNINLRKFRISTRFALFDTDNYDNRQYVYERDVLYSYTIPPYSGRGTRQYVMAQYKLTRKIDVWARYARTHYRNQEKISSGNEEIDGNIKTDVKLQMRMRF